jgi:hypothetical protein
MNQRSVGIRKFYLTPADMIDLKHSIISDLRHQTLAVLVSDPL